jgi:predicted enzyme related to lactoylglutathione lyase
MSKKHSICHVEWGSTNLERTQVFYGGLFDWKFMPFGDEYMVFQAPEHTGGGFAKMKEVKAGGSPLVYVQVDEIEPYLEKAKALGGHVEAPKSEIPTIGWFAHLKDPDGNIVGLVQEGAHRG